MKAYLIDAGARTVTPIEYQRGADFRKWLPGGICIAWVYNNGDVLYVDDKALLKAATVAFRIKARPDGQPMMCNGILTGRDDVNDTLPPEFTLAAMETEIEWLTVDNALAWFRAKAEEPAVTSTFGGRREVHANWSELLLNLEGGKGYKPYEDETLLGRMAPR